MGNTDLMVHLETDEEDLPARFMSGRRLVRWVSVLAAGILAVLVLWQDPLYALQG
jgi:hypothetical protein